MWLESIEALLHISRCAEENKVEYASYQFQEGALSWWNREIQVRGRELLYGIPWVEFKKLLMEKYCPREEVQRMEFELWNHEMVGLDNEKYTTRFLELVRLAPSMVDTEEKLVERYIYGLVPEIRRLVIASNPTTLQEAISATNRMVIDCKRSGDFTEATNDSKGKNEGSSGVRKGKKKRRNVRSFGVASSESTKYKGPHPQCDKCSYHHVGDCSKCPKCNKVGHTAKYCRNKSKAEKKRKACFKCGSIDHLLDSCPEVTRTPIHAVPLQMIRPGEAHYDSVAGIFVIIDFETSVISNLERKMLVNTSRYFFDHYDLSCRHS
jgi:hypothetical protein